MRSSPLVRFIDCETNNLYLEYGRWVLLAALILGEYKRQNIARSATFKEHKKRLDPRHMLTISLKNVNVWTTSLTSKSVQLVYYSSWHVLVYRTDGVAEEVSASYSSPYPSYT